MSSKGYRMRKNKTACVHAIKHHDWLCVCGRVCVCACKCVCECARVWCNTTQSFLPKSGRLDTPRTTYKTMQRVCPTLSGTRSLSCRSGGRHCIKSVFVNNTRAPEQHHHHQGTTRATHQSQNVIKQNRITCGNNQPHA